MKSGKGRHQDDDDDQPDPLDLQNVMASNPMARSSLSPGQLLGDSIGSFSDSPRSLGGSARKANTGPAPGALGREISGIVPLDSRTSGGSSMASSAPVRSAEVTQLSRISGTAAELDKLRIKLLEGLQHTDDVLCENADQMDVVQQHLDYVDGVCKILDSHLDQVERDQQDAAGDLTRLLQRLRSEAERCQTLDRKDELLKDVDDMAARLRQLD